MSLKDNLLPLGLAAGGGVLLYREFAKNEKLETIRKLLSKADRDIRNELEGGVSDEELDRHISYYSATSATMYSELDKEVKDQVPSPSEMESEVSGYTKEEKALAWKHYAESIAASRELEEAGASILDDYRWLIVGLGLGAFGATAYSFRDFIQTSINRWRNNPDTDPSDADARSSLATIEFINDMVYDGQDSVGTEPEPEAQEPPDPSEDPIAERSWSEIGQALPGTLSTIVLTYWDLESTSDVKIYQYAPDLVAEMTNKSVEWYWEQPIPVQLGLVVLLVIFAKAIGALAGIGSIGAVGGSYAANAIAGGLFITLGIRIDEDKVHQKADELVDELEIT